uniref:Uncharacterized protein n=1 Tax=Quercus lobata TaxID=97700 RepID=A0A7N2L7K8_QUELO
MGRSSSPPGTSESGGNGEGAFYFLVLLAVFLYAISSMVLQSLITTVSRQGSEQGRRLNREGLRIGVARLEVELSRFVVIEAEDWS